MPIPRRRPVAEVGNEAPLAAGGGGPWLIPEGPVFPKDEYNAYSICYLCGGPAVDKVEQGDVCAQHLAAIEEVRQIRARMRSLSLRLSCLM